MRIKRSKIPIPSSRSSGSFSNEQTYGLLSPPCKRVRSRCASTECNLTPRNDNKICEAEFRKCVVSRIPIYKNAYEIRTVPDPSQLSIKFSQRVYYCPLPIKFLRRRLEPNVTREGEEDVSPKPVSPDKPPNDFVDSDQPDYKPKEKQKSEIGFVNPNEEISSPKQSFDGGSTSVVEPVKEKSLTKRPTFSSIGLLVNPLRKPKKEKLSAKEASKYKKRKRQFPRVSEGEIPPFLFCGSLEKKIYNVSK